MTPEQLLQNKQSLEDEINRIETALHAAQGRLSQCRTSIQKAEEALGGYESGLQRTPNDRTMQDGVAETNRALDALKTELPTAQAEVAKLDEQLANLRGQLAELSNGACRLPLAIAEHQQAESLIEQAKATQKDLLQRYEANAQAQNKQRQQVQALERELAKAMTPEAVKQADSAHRSALQDAEALQVLRSNIEREMNANQQRLTELNQQLDQRHKGIWQAKCADLLDDVPDEIGDVLEAAFAALCAAGQGGAGFHGFLRHTFMMDRQEPTPERIAELQKELQAEIGGAAALS